MADSTTSEFEPVGLHAVRPYFIVGDAVAAIEFYTQAFGAEELERHTDPTGYVAHAKLRIGDTIFELGQHPDAVGREAEALPRVGMRLYVEDVDEAFARAVDAGATAGDPPAERRPGSRVASVSDPAGLTWWLAATLE